MSNQPLLRGECQAIPARGLSLETTTKFGYFITEQNGQPCQVAPYYAADRSLVAQKIRFAGKVFTVAGDMKHALLWGQQLWGESGKRVVVVEGEIDAMSVSQCQGNRWPVVSIPNGASGAKKALQGQLAWLEGFDEVVLLFDNDAPGIEATNECAVLFSPGKCKVASLPLKDANDMLRAGRVDEVIQALWSAKTYRPDGILNAQDMWSLLSKQDEKERIEWPWPQTQAKLNGMGTKQLTMICAGSGIGKSHISREIAAYLLGLGETIGYIGLEESVKESAMALLAIQMEKPLYKMNEVPLEELKPVFDSVYGTGRAFFYDCFGSLDSGNLLNRIRYLARGCGCRWIFLDHISIVVSGISEGDERRTIDNLMTSLRSAVQELDVGLFAVCHLKRPSGEGSSYNEGRSVSLSDLRGSASLEQLSDNVLGLERNQQDAATANETTLRVLKCRRTGKVGVADVLVYGTEKGVCKVKPPVSPFTPEPTNNGEKDAF